MRRPDQPFRTKYMAGEYDAMMALLRRLLDADDPLFRAIAGLDKAFVDLRTNAYEAGWQSVVNPSKAPAPAPDVDGPLFRQAAGMEASDRTRPQRFAASVARHERVAQLAYRAAPFHFPWKDEPLPAHWVLCDPVADFIGPTGCLCKTIQIGAYSLIPDGPCSIAFAAPDFPLLETSNA
jgi:hypothetical protein